MAEKKIARYGSWKSPITSDLIVAATIGLSDISIDDGDIYWSEVRPTEGGRCVVVRCAPDGSIADITPPPFNARTRVHEYGGGAFAVSNGDVFFSNFNDGRLFRQDRGSQPRPLTPEADLRYADIFVDRARGLLYCVREDHTTPGTEPANEIVSIPIDGDSSGGRIVVSGSDFYANPRLSPDGSRLSWISWNHPNMPWDGTELWVAHLDDDGAIVSRELIAGGIAESIFQPEWSPEGVLHFVSDQTGWWNLYCHRDGKAIPLCQMEAEFGAPLWVFGMSTYAFLSSQQLVCAYVDRGIWQLATLDHQKKRLAPLESRYSDIRYLRAMGDKAVICGGGPIDPVSIVKLDVVSGKSDVLRRATNVQVDGGYLSVPRAIEFPTEGGLTAHAFFYAPHNRDYDGPQGERPPLIVISHGGPTAASATTLSLSIQYWTSRGIGVLDVNYGGSTGYGRAYRERLNGKWGIVDVDDCINGARYLVSRSEADGDRLIIRGGSAGGYTTLAALTFRDVFKAGASYFGISDLEALELDTHKFEAKYSGSLVGPYPERRDLYRERSPIHYIDRLSCPIILFQGLEDRVVPPNQAEMMFDAVRKKGLPVAYVPFAGEQHGFRRAENIKRALDAELYFYSRVFRFDLADPVDPVAIENLE